MSEWYEANTENIEYDYDDKTVNIHVKSNDNGNVYVEISFDTIKDMFLKINGTCETCFSSEVQKGIGKCKKNRWCGIINQYTNSNFYCGFWRHYE